MLRLRVRACSFGPGRVSDAPHLQGAPELHTLVLMVHFICDGMLHSCIGTRRSVATCEFDNARAHAAVAICVCERYASYVAAFSRWRANQAVLQPDWCAVVAECMCERYAIYVSV